MKILMVTPYFHPKIGGLENYVSNLIEKLLQDPQISICVITSNHESKNYERIVKSDRYKIYRLPIQFVLSNTPINIKWYADIEKIIIKEKPDIIHAHAPVPYIADISAAASGNIPFILTYHAGSMIKNIFFPDLLIKVYEKIILQRMLNKATRIIINSKKTLPYFLTSKKKKIEYVHPGVDAKLFTPKKTKNITNHVLYVGKVEKSAQWKGIEYLLKAIDLIKNYKKDIHLNIVGYGDAIEMYKQFCEEKNISKNVIFHGELKGKNLIQMYQSSDMLVLPSTSEAESFGMVLIEAMSCGLPVIGSNLGGIPFVIDHEINGLLTKPQDAQAIADAISYLYDNPNKIRAYGKNAHAKAIKQFTWDRAASSYKKIYYDYAK